MRKQNKRRPKRRIWHTCQTEKERHRGHVLTQENCIKLPNWQHVRPINSVAKIGKTHAPKRNGLHGQRLLDVHLHPREVNKNWFTGFPLVAIFRNFPPGVPAHCLFMLFPASSVESLRPPISPAHCQGEVRQKIFLLRLVSSTHSVKYSQLVPVGSLVVRLTTTMTTTTMTTTTTTGHVSPYCWSKFHCKYL